MPYRWTHKQLTRANGDVIKAGETFKPTAAERRAFGDRIEEVDPTTAEPDADPVAATGALTDLDGVGEAKADALRTAGFPSFEALRDADLDELAAISGVSERLATDLINQVSEE